MYDSCTVLRPSQGYHSPMLATHMINKSHATTSLQKCTTPTHHGLSYNFPSTPTMGLSQSPQSTKARTVSIQCPSPERSSLREHLTEDSESPVLFADQLHSSNTETVADKSQLSSFQLSTDSPKQGHVDESPDSLCSLNVSQPGMHSSRSSKMKGKEAPGKTTGKGKGISKKTGTKGLPKVAHASGSDTQTDTVAKNTKHKPQTPPNPHSSSPAGKAAAPSVVGRRSQRVASASATLRMKEFIESPPGKKSTSQVLSQRKRKLSEGDKSDTKKVKRAKTVENAAPKQKSKGHEVSLKDDDTSDWTSTDDSETEIGNNRTSNPSSKIRSITTKSKPLGTTTKSKPQVNGDSSSEWETDSDIESTPTQAAMSTAITKTPLDKSQTTEVGKTSDSNTNASFEEAPSNHDTAVNAPEMNLSKLTPSLESHAKSEGREETSDNTLPHSSAKKLTAVEKTCTPSDSQKEAEKESSQVSTSAGSRVEQKSDKAVGRREAPDIISSSSSEWSSDEECDGARGKSDKNDTAEENARCDKNVKKSDETNEGRSIDSDDRRAQATKTLESWSKASTVSSPTKGTYTLRDKRRLKRKSQERSRVSKATKHPVITEPHTTGNVNRDGAQCGDGVESVNDTAAAGTVKLDGGVSEDITKSGSNGLQNDSQVLVFATNSLPSDGEITTEVLSQSQGQCIHACTCTCAVYAIAKHVNKSLRFWCNARIYIIYIYVYTYFIMCVLILSLHADAVTVIEETQETRDSNRSPSPEIPFLGHSDPTVHYSSAPNRKVQSDVTLCKDPVLSSQEKDMHKKLSNKVANKKGVTSDLNSDRDTESEIPSNRLKKLKLSKTDATAKEISGIGEESSDAVSASSKPSNKSSKAKNSKCGDRSSLTVSPHSGAQIKGKKRKSQDGKNDACNVTASCDTTHVPSSQTDGSDGEMDHDKMSLTIASRIEMKESLLQLSRAKSDVTQKSNEEQSDFSQVGTEMDESCASVSMSGLGQSMAKKKRKHKKKKRKPVDHEDSCSESSITTAAQSSTQHTDPVQPVLEEVESRHQEKNGSNELLSAESDMTEQSSKVTVDSEETTQSLGKRKKHKRRKQNRGGLKVTTTDQQLQVISEETSADLSPVAISRTDGNLGHSMQLKSPKSDCGKLNPNPKDKALSSQGLSDEERHSVCSPTNSGSTCIPLQESGGKAEDGFLKPVTTPPKKCLQLNIRHVTPAAKIDKSHEESLSATGPSHHHGELKKTKTKGNNLLSVFSVTGKTPLISGTCTYMCTCMYVQSSVYCCVCFNTLLVLHILSSHNLIIQKLSFHLKRLRVNVLGLLVKHI